MLIQYMSIAHNGLTIYDCPEKTRIYAMERGEAMVTVALLRPVVSSICLRSQD